MTTATETDQTSADPVERAERLHREVLALYGFMAFFLLGVAALGVDVAFVYG